MPSKELTILKTYLNVQNKTRVAIKSLQFLTKGEIPNNFKGLDNLIRSINLTLIALNDELKQIVFDVLLTFGNSSNL